jgi:hypothetical protein
MKLGIGTHEEYIYACAPIVQPSTINHQHLPSLQGGGNLHTHKNFKKHPQIMTENLQKQTKCANPL